MRTLRKLMGLTAYTLIALAADSGASASTGSAKSAKKSSSKKSKSQALKDKAEGGKHEEKENFTASEHRQPGSPLSTALGGPGPMSPTNEDGTFKGKPGEDVQLRDPLAPTERRNAVAADHGAKPETNVSRADHAGMQKLTPHAHHENFDARLVAPAVVDQENAKAHKEAQAAADKALAEQEKARVKAEAKAERGEK